MPNPQNGWRFFETPHVATFSLITVNIVIFALCLRYSNSAAISTELLFRNGAMYSSAIGRHEYWRLIAYGFLHANPFHLVTNMLCLALWGGPLERRVGAFYFLVIYISALVGGGIVSSLAHTGPYLAVGASGAISGILGALLCLWLLGNVDLSLNFFVINIGLNVALAVTASKIDWAAHLGGFSAGLIGCALLDLVERFNAVVFRCKFPEFVKLNLFALAAVIWFILWTRHPSLFPGIDIWVQVLLYGAACLALVKSFDLILSLKKGLAIGVVILAGANVVLTLLAGIALAPVIASNCVSPNLGVPQMEAVIDAACSHANATVGIAAAGVLVLTLLLYSQELYRGINDLGFVGAALRAERRRRHGI